MNVNSIQRDKDNHVFIQILMRRVSIWTDRRSLSLFRDNVLLVKFRKCRRRENPNELQYTFFSVSRSITFPIRWPLLPPCRYKARNSFCLLVHACTTRERMCVAWYAKQMGKIGRCAMYVSLHASEVNCFVNLKAVFAYFCQDLCYRVNKMTTSRRIRFFVVYIISEMILLPFFIIVLPNT